MNISDYVASVIRTTVGIAVGGLIGLAVQADWLADVDTTGWEEAIVGGVMVIYYAAVRKLESINPLFGWALGLPRPPHYQAPEK